MLTQAVLAGNVCWFGAASYTFTMGASTFVARNIPNRAASADTRADLVYACR